MVRRGCRAPRSFYEMPLELIEEFLTVRPGCLRTRFDRDGNRAAAALCAGAADNEKKKNLSTGSLKQHGSDHEFSKKRPRFGEATETQGDVERDKRMEPRQSHRDRQTQSSSDS